MNIVIPIAGEGKRFVDSGFVLPKPLIQIGNKIMYNVATECMPLHLATKLIFILKEGKHLELLIDNIKERYASYPYVIKVLNENTRGQAETILKAVETLDLNNPTLVHNCDTYISPSFSWDKLLSKNIDGAIVLFSSNQDRWSYASLNIDETKVVDIKEKRVISCNASTGTYFFQDTSLLLSNIRKIIQLELQVNNEYYLSTVYSLMLTQGKYIMPLWARKILCFGTPQDLIDSMNYLLVKYCKHPL